MGCSSPTGLLTLEIMPKSRLRCHSAWMLYVFEASVSKTRADLLYLIWVLFEPFPYPPRRFYSPSFFHFNSIWEGLWLTACSVLDCPSSKSSPSTSPLPSSSESESVSFALSFQNQVAVSASSLLVSVVLGLSLSILGCNELWTELVSNLLFLKNSTEAALAAFYCSHWRLEGIMIKLGQLVYSFNYDGIRWLWWEIE